MLNGMIMGKNMGKSNNQKKTHGPILNKTKMVGFQPCSNGAFLRQCYSQGLTHTVKKAAALDGAPRSFLSHGVGSTCANDN